MTHNFFKSLKTYLLVPLIKRSRIILQYFTNETFIFYTLWIVKFVKDKFSVANYSKYMNKSSLIEVV